MDDDQSATMLSVASPAMPTELPGAIPPVGRRWYQFSLRTLLIGMMLVSMLAGLVGIRVQRARRQRDAAVSLGRIGGQLNYASNDSVPLVVRDLLEPQLGRDFFDSVVEAEVDLRFADTTPGHLAAWRAISDLPQLTTLRVDYPRRYPLSRFNIGPIRRLTKLHTLKIRDARIDGDDLAPLATMPALVWLDLSHNQVGDSTWRHLAAVPKLQRLDASYSFVGDEGAAHLAECQGLRTLVLTRTNITDRGAAKLAKIAGLEVLVLDGTKITDAGLASLASVESLWKLTICETRVTDQGLAALSSATNLSSLDVSQTNVTPLGARQLLELRPRMKVTY